VTTGSAFEVADSAIPSRFATSSIVVTPGVSTASGASSGGGSSAGGGAPRAASTSAK
jgi:hypothetical protein